MTTYRAGMLQSQAHRSLSNHLGEALKPYGITMAGWAALGIIHDAKDIRVTTLAEELGVRPPVATNIVRELEKRGLIGRETSTEDNRVSVLRPTPKGTEMVNTVELSLRKDLRDFLHDVSLTDLMTYMRVLKKLADKL